MIFHLPHDPGRRRVLANYLIGLREGLEAGLIVGILVAYLSKIGRRDALPKLWIGIAGAIVLSLGVGAILTWGPYGLSFEAQEIIGGVLSLVAVGMVTWMIFWMANHSRGLKSELQGKADLAIGGSAAALVTLGTVSVGREGLETALFVWASAKSTVDPLISFLAVVGGILTAVVLAVLISAGVLRINLSKFFTWTGAVLILVAAGVLAYAIGELQEASVLPGWGQHAYSIAGLIPTTSWWGALLGGLFGVTAEPTWAQVGVWIAYVAIVGVFFIRRQRTQAPAPQPQREPVGSSV